ncbi:MAG: LysR family transcriptional regulator [Pseudooceanicola sp.]|nr:LysR family transcriptional regulator [Pseudooceanicola sp.]
MKGSHVWDGRLPLLDLRHLAMIDALGRTGGLTHAAEALGVTQSALSHRLREAERRLGVALAEKRGRGVALTMAGERLRVTAQRLLRDMAAVESEVREVGASGIRHRVQLGQAGYADLRWLPAFSDWLARHLPEVQVSVHSGNGGSTVEDLLEGAIDLLLTPTRPLVAGIDVAAIGTDQLVAVAAPGHPWAAKAEILPEDLRDETFLAYSFERAPDMENARFMQPAQAFPARVIRVGHTEAVYEMVAAGQGVSILAGWPSRNRAERGDIVLRPLRPLGSETPGLAITWQASVRGGAAADPAHRCLAELVAWSQVGMAFSDRGETWA